MLHAGPQLGTCSGLAETSDLDEPVKPGQHELSAEQGLKHLLLTVDVERLYRLDLPTSSAMLAD